MVFCAEHTAIWQMVTQGEYKIKKIVAVHKNKKGDIDTQDYTLPGPRKQSGGIHPLTKTINKIERIFQRIGLKLLSHRLKKLIYFQYIIFSIFWRRYIFYY